MLHQSQKKMGSAKIRVEAFFSISSSSPTMKGLLATAIIADNHKNRIKDSLINSY